jgi:energy-converting hydrogenase B subunit L
LFGEAGTIHPNDVGEIESDISEQMEKPVKISEDKIAYISQFLADNTVLRKRKE